MGGSPSAVLSGLSTPVAYTKWDHTYVASDCGWVWRCWGAHTGGHILIHGRGSSFLANCLSKPNGTAEVRYGIDGVCHQTANRILLPAARLRVSAARGYNVSFTAYGHYGHKRQRGWAAWARRLADCMGATPTSHLLADYVGVDRQKTLGKDAAMTDDTHGPSERNGGADPRVSELLGYMEGGGTIERVREMCNPHLEQPLAVKEELALAEIQDWFDGQQRAHVESLETGRTERHAYLAAMNELLAQAMARYSEVLGETRFVKVFGEAGFEPDKLIDRATFLAGH